MKRLFDFIASGLMLLVLSPLFFIISIIIKLNSKGPIIFKQVRGGYKGEHFTIYKFRTMTDGAEMIGTGYKVTRNDSRITRVGNLLRKTSLDEIPQLYNILKGDMSFVGPRPALPVQTDNYNDFEKVRLEVKPGVTGWAQVNGRNTLTWEERIKYDVVYVKNKSFKMDCKILFKTLVKVVSFADIYTDSIDKGRK